VFIVKKHPIRPVTVRRYYPGVHQVDLIINGKPMACTSFELRFPLEC
jgi:hypothetical protein